MTLAEIQKKITELESQKMRAELQIEQILTEWKALGINSIQEAEAEVLKLTADIKADEARYESLMEKIEGLADWDSL